MEGLRDSLRTIWIKFSIVTGNCIEAVLLIGGIGTPFHSTMFRIVGSFKAHSFHGGCCCFSVQVVMRSRILGIRAHPFSLKVQRLASCGQMSEPGVRATAKRVPVAKIGRRAMLVSVPVAVCRH
jgi:hypothetical protein